MPKTLYFFHYHATLIIISIRGIKLLFSLALWKKIMKVFSTLRDTLLHFNQLVSKHSLLLFVKYKVTICIKKSNSRWVSDTDTDTDTDNSLF